MTENEKDVLFLINLARINGKKFSDTFLEDWLKNNNYYNKKSEYIKSLYKDLANLDPLNPLNPDSSLYKAAVYHAKDMGKKGTIGHNSSDGTSFSQRLRKYVNTGFMGENCYYGLNKPIDIVIILLIDEGIKDVGHRKNILNNNYNKIGISIQPHKKYGYNCVQDFSE